MSNFENESLRRTPGISKNFFRFAIFGVISVGLNNIVITLISSIMALVEHLYTGSHGKNAENGYHGS